MALILGSPQTWQELDEAFAALQVWVGKTEGLGKWTTLQVTNDMLKNEGAGNSWTQGSYAGQSKMTYTVIGNTMILNFFIFNTTLTVATAIIAVAIKIPGNYKATTVPAYGYTQVTNNAVAEAGQVNVATETHLNISKASFANITNDAGTFSVYGSIVFEIIPKA